MKMNTLAKVATKNEHARILLEGLKVELACVCKELKERKKKQIVEENSHLTQDINVALSNLIKLETLRGRKQISLPSPECKERVQFPAQKEIQKIDKKLVQKCNPTKRTINIKSGNDSPKPKKLQESTTEVDDVSRLDFRIGQIVEVTRHPEADSLYLEKIDCGETSPRTVISGLVKFVPIEEMKDRMVIVLCNLKPAKMRGITSEAMVMCASTPEKVEVLIPPAGVVPGELVHCEGYERNPDLMLNPKKKVFETCAPDLSVNDNLVFCYKGKPFIVPEKGEIKSRTLKNVQVK